MLFNVVMPNINSGDFNFGDIEMNQSALYETDGTIEHGTASQLPSIILRKICTIIV
jgi:hypothetical protein